MVRVTSGSRQKSIRNTCAWVGSFRSCTGFRGAQACLVEVVEEIRLDTREAHTEDVVSEESGDSGELSGEQPCGRVVDEDLHDGVVRRFDF